MTRAVRILASIALLFFAAISGLVFSASRSDFLFRDCHNIPKDTWGETANCSDGWLGQVIFGGGSLALIVAAILVLRRVFI